MHQKFLFLIQIRTCKNSSYCFPINKKEIGTLTSYWFKYFSKSFSISCKPQQLSRNIMNYQLVTYKRISSGSMTSYRLPILINNKFGEIPLDETEIIFEKLAKEKIFYGCLCLTFQECLPVYSSDNSTVDVYSHCLHRSWQTCQTSHYSQLQNAWYLHWILVLAHQIGCMGNPKFLIPVKNKSLDMTQT